jgi:hypothetical protein
MLKVNPFQRGEHQVGGTDKFQWSQADLAESTDPGSLDTCRGIFHHYAIKGWETEMSCSRQEQVRNRLGLATV